MNRFVRNFIVLPLIFFIFFFHAGAIGACSCGSVLPGKEIPVTISVDGNKWEPITPNGQKSKKIAKQLISQLIVNANKFYIFKVGEKNTALIEAVEKWKLKKSKSSEEEVKKVKAADSFIKAFLSSKNNHFYRFEFQSQEIKKLQNDEEIPIEFHFSEVEAQKKVKKVDLITIQAFFQEEENTKSPEKWKFLLKIDQVKITRDSQGVLKSFDFQESNLEIDELKKIN